MRRKGLCFFLACFIFLIFSLGFVGCSSGSMAGDSSQSPDEGGSSVIVAEELDRKIVYTVNMDIETGEVSAVRDSLLDSGKAAGGYVEQQNDYGGSNGLSRTYLVLRIPTEKLDAFLEGAEGLGKIRSKRVSTTDITTQYVSASARKTAYEERKAQLEAILAEDGLSASDRVSVIDSISEVNAALQELELQLTQYDSLVDYSTVRLDIYRAENVWAIVGIVLLVLVFLGLAAGTVVFGFKYSVEKHKNRSSALQEGENGAKPEKINKK